MRKIYLFATVLSAFAMLAGCGELENTIPENADVPSMITDATAASINGGVKLSWKNPENRFGYVKIDFTHPVSGNAEVARAVYPSTSWTLDGLTPEHGSVSFQLTTVSASGVLSTTSTTVTAAATIPSGVSNFVAKAGASVINLTWTNPDDATIDHIEISYTDPRTGSATKGQTISVKVPYLSGKLDGVLDVTELLPEYGAITFTAAVVGKNGLRSASATASATALAPIPPVDVTDLIATAGAGKITLSWIYPADTRITKAEVSYVDPRDGSATKGQTITTNVTYPTSTLDVADLLAKYGEIEFTVTVVVRTAGLDLRSPGVKCTGKSNLGKVLNKLPLTADMLSSDASDPSEGNLANLVDGNVTNYWHSNWHKAVPFPNHIQVALPQTVTKFMLRITNRNRAAYGIKTAEVLVVDNGAIVKVTRVGEIKDGNMSNDASAVFDSPSYELPDKGAINAIQLKVLSVYGGIGNPDAKFWCLAELEVYATEDEVAEPQP